MKTKPNNKANLLKKIIGFAARRKAHLMPGQHIFFDTLIDNCKKAKQAVPKDVIVKEYCVSSCDIEKKCIVRSFDTSAFNKVRNAVYVIEEINGDAKSTFERFKLFKEKKERKCPKTNRESKILYVGSCEGCLEDRLKQHFGCNNNKSTYALNLSHWFKGKLRIEAKIYDVTPEVLQIIEDSLVNCHKPAFGKMGGNGRKLD